MTQIIRGQAVSTAISGASPIATVGGQGAASPAAVGQTQPGTTRAQGQGQVKLTLAQLGQLIQVSEELVACSTIPQGWMSVSSSALHKALGRLGIKTGKAQWGFENQKGNVHISSFLLGFNKSIAKE